MKKTKMRIVVLFCVVLFCVVGVFYETQQCRRNNELRQMYDLLNVYGWRWSEDDWEWYTFSEGRTPIIRLQEDTLYDLYRRDISTFIEVVSDF